MSLYDDIWEKTNRSFSGYINDLVQTEGKKLFEDKIGKWFLRKPGRYGNTFKRYGKIISIDIFMKSSVMHWEEIFTLQIKYENIKGQEKEINIAPWSFHDIEFFDDKDAMLLYKEIGGSD